MEYNYFPITLVEGNFHLGWPVTEKKIALKLKPEDPRNKVLLYDDM